jgi:YbbR domain-containing protein
MDRLLKSPWFVKIIAFLLALLLYTVVGMDQNDDDASGIFSNDDTEQIERDVDVEAKYDTDKYILTGMPTIIKDVEFEGTNAAISRFRLQRAPDIVIDLTEYDEGEYNISLEISNIPEDITAKIPDKNVKVTLHKLVTKTFPVQIELLNTNELTDGYIAEPAEFSVKEAKVTGAEVVVDSIVYVKGFVDVGNVKNNLIREVELKAYNEDMGEIQVALEPGTIEVKVPISNPKKDVPISIREEGTLPENLTLISIETDIKQAAVYGPMKVLDKLNDITIPVDLSEVTEDKTYKVSLTLPDGAFNIEPKEVTITIDVEEKEDAESVTLKDVPISINGLTDGVEATFISPKNGLLNLIVKGSKEDIDTLVKSDIIALVNIQDLSEGEHSVKIEITGPDRYVYQHSITEALLTIENQTT